MTSPTTIAPPDTSVPAPRSWQTVLLVLLGPLGIWAAVVVAGSAFAADSLPGGQCEGIGWGCTLTPRDSLLFGGFVVGIVVVPVVTIVAAITARVSSATNQLRNVLVLLACFAGFTVTAVTLVSA